MNRNEPKGLCSSCDRANPLDAETCPLCNAPLSTKGLTSETSGAQAERPQNYSGHSGVKSAYEVNSMTTRQESGDYRSRIDSSIPDHCVRERAYEIYSQRGRRGCHADSDWLTAEAELKELKKKAADMVAAVEALTV